MRHQKFLAVMAVASTLTIASLVDATAASAGPTPYKVTVSASKTSVVIDQAIKVSGSVSPTYQGQTIELQRKTSKGYKDVSKHRIVKGKYSFMLRPTAPGSFTYRIYVSKHGSRPAGNSKAFGARVYQWHYLSSLQPVDGGWGTGDIEINGKNYSQSIYVGAIGFGVDPSNQPVGYNVKRECSELIGVEGLDDSSTPGDDYEFQIIGDGNVLSDHDVPFGTAQPVIVKLSTVLRLTISVLDGNNVVHPGDDGYGVGNARVLCRF